MALPINENKKLDLRMLNLFLKQLRSNPDLIPKKVTVHPKMGRPYQAVRWVKRDEVDKDDEEHVEEEREESSRNIFGFKPESPEDFIQQAELIRNWIIDDAFEADWEEIEEKIGWFVQNVNDNEQNELVQSDIQPFLTDKVGEGINKSMFITLENGKKGIFKSNFNEDTYGNQTIDSLQHLHEVAAYKFSKMFPEFDGLVPPTALRGTGNNGEEGSIQEFMEGAETFRSIMFEQVQKNIDDLALMRNADEIRKELMKNTFNQEELENAALFDVIVESSDRHSLNFMLHEGKLKLIDNGLTFSAKGNRFGYFNDIIWEAGLRDEPIKDSHKKIVQNILDRKNELEQELSPYLSRASLDRMIYRLEDILEEGATYGSLLGT